METELSTRLARIESRLRRAMFLNLFFACAIVGLLGYCAHLHLAMSMPQTLTVRQLTLVDERGVRRLVLGAPLPEPITLGQQRHRDAPVSGMLIYDAKGNERGGYATDDGYGNAMLTLDNEKTQSVLLLVEPSGSVFFKLWNDAGSITTGVSDDPYLNLKQNGNNVFVAPADNPQSRDQRPMFRK